MTTELESRERALALLRHNHDFPGPYAFRVVVRQGRRSAVLEAVVGAAGEVVATSERPSRHGTYLSLRLEVHVASAEAVLDLYAALEAVDGVLATL